MISALILAAGKSSRMGESKPLVQFGKQTFLEAVLSNFKNAGIKNVLIVLGYNAEQIVKKLNLPSESYEINEKSHLGQLSSVQTGLRKLPSGCSGTFLALVDQPQISSQVITQIQTVFKDHQDKIVIPTHNGKRGHPPVLPNWLFQEILNAPASKTTSEIIRSHLDMTYELEISDKTILWNINTKQDLLRALKHFGS